MHREPTPAMNPIFNRTITTKFGIRFDGHRGEWQHAETGWEVSREHLEAIFKSIGVERKRAWDAWAQTEGRPFFEPPTQKGKGIVAETANGEQRPRL
jgi:hypothetical protein